MADILSVDDSGDDDIISRKSSYAEEFSDNGLCLYLISSLLTYLFLQGCSAHY